MFPIFCDLASRSTFVLFFRLVSPFRSIPLRGRSWIPRMSRILSRRALHLGILVVLSRLPMIVSASIADHYGSSRVSSVLIQLLKLTEWQRSPVNTRRTRRVRVPRIRASSSPNGSVRNLAMCKFMYGGRWFVNALHYALRRCRS